MRTLIVLLTALIFTGCATPTGGSVPTADKVSFDRGAFALAYADVISPVRALCAKTPTTAYCIQLTLLDGQVRQAIIDAPKAAAAAAAAAPPGLDLSVLLPLIMKLAPLAAGL